MTFQPTAFLSLPITANLNEDGVFRDDRQAFYAGVIAALQRAGLAVVSAATNEDWGRVKLTVPEFTRFDYEAIVAAQWLVVVASERVSRDIYLEIGIALGKGLPVALFFPTETPMTYMLQGLIELNHVTVCRYDDESVVAELVEKTARVYLLTAGTAGVLAE